MARVTTEVWQNEYELYNYQVRVGDDIVAMDENYTTEGGALEDARFGLDQWLTGQARAGSVET